MKKIIGFITLGFLALTLAACGSSTSADQDAMANQLGTYQKNGQNVHGYQWSQIRQTLQDVQDATVTGEATTSFFFNLGVWDPYFVCPSIGFPVPATDELTNPLQNVGNQGAVVSQMDPNGVFPGQTAGTWVICVAPNGAKELHYAEPQDHTVGGPAHWDHTKGIVLDGAPSVAVKVGQK